jgi:hypothetical protein
MMLAARAAGLISMSALGLRTLGFHRTKARIAALRRGTARPAADCVLAIRRARQYSPLSGNCLSQSLALLWMLQRAGHDAALRIGVKSDQGRMLAHAWIELDGVAIDPAAIADGYAPLHA